MTQEFARFFARGFGRLLIGLVAGCFEAPGAAVMFSCDPEGDGVCPAGYSCEPDGCCHRDGSDVDAHASECKLVGTGSGFPGGSGATSPTTAGGSSETVTATSQGSTSQPGSDASTEGPTSATSGDSSTAG